MGAGRAVASRGLLGAAGAGVARAVPIVAAAIAVQQVGLAAANATQGFAPEIAGLIQRTGLVEGTLGQLEGTVRGLSDDVSRIMSGEFIRRFLELERLEAFSVAATFAEEGEKLAVGEAILGDLGSAFTRVAQRDRFVERRNAVRRQRGAILAIKEGATDLWGHMAGNLGGG